MTLREQNRALLARQLLLERARLAVPRALERLCALQAQYSPSPYVALWSRLGGFEKEQLTRALERRQVVKATLMRVTLHLVAASDFPYFAAAWLPAAHARFPPSIGRDAVERAARVVHEAAGEPRTVAELTALVADELAGVEWRVRALAPLVHVPPSGTWRYHGRPQLIAAERWLGKPMPDARAGAATLARRYLGAFGPATAKDLARFAGTRLGDLRPGLDALEPLRRFRAEDGRILLDLPRAPRPPADTPTPVRFLPKWDALFLSHDDRTHILPSDLRPAVFRDNGDVQQTFLVDGSVAGTWRIERAKTKATIVLEPLAPLPRAVRDEAGDEATRLVRFVEPDASAFATRFA